MIRKLIYTLLALTLTVSGTVAQYHNQSATKHDQYKYCSNCGKPLNGENAHFCYTCEKYIPYWELNSSVLFNVGAMAPIPVPSPVKHIYTWYPNINPALNFTITRWMNSNWGLTTGITLEVKSFEATTKIENMDINVVSDDESGLGGHFTGFSNTDIKNNYFTIPLMATWRTNNQKLNLNFGLYGSFLMKGHFRQIIDGNLHVETIDKAVIDDPYDLDMDMSKFDFDDRISNYDFGVRFDAEYYFTDRLSGIVGLRFGFTNTMKSSFDYMKYKMYNMFGCFGIGYRL